MATLNYEFLEYTGAFKDTIKGCQGLFWLGWVYLSVQIGGLYKFLNLYNNKYKFNAK